MHSGAASYLASPAAKDIPAELLVDIALTEWVNDRNGPRATRKLARVLLQEHHSRWLSDYLRKSPAGTSELAGAIRANASSSYAQAMKDAIEAARKFRSVGNQAGALRAEQESLYASQRMLDASDCLARADRFSRESHRFPYPALRAQADLEIAACRSLSGQVGAALSASQASLAEARAGGDQSIALRAIAFLSAYQVDLGDDAEIWKPTMAAMEIFWNSAYPVTRGQFLLINLSLAAEHNGQFFAAYVFRKEALSLIQHSTDQLLVALSYSKLGSMANRIGDNLAAIEHYLQAEKLFAKLPQTPAVQQYRQDAAIARAIALAQIGKPAAGAKILEQLNSPSGKLATPLMSAELHTQLGRFYLQTGDPRAAAEFQNAIQLGRAREAGRSASDGERLGLAPADYAYRGLAAIFAAKGEWRAALDVWEKRNFQSSVYTETERNEAILVYAVFENRLAVWILRDGGIEGKWLSIRERDLREEVARFQHLCSDPASSGQLWRTSARRLYDQLLGPVENELRSKDVLAFEPDGDVNEVPLAALLSPDGKFVGDRFALVSIDNVRAYLRRKQKMTPRLPVNVPVLAVQDPALRGAIRTTYAPLPDAADEVTAIQKRFHNLRTLAGPAATLQNVNRLQAEAAVFHFAGHGFSNASAGGLLLAPEDNNAEADVFDSEAIERANWRGCQLVVLSACSTAKQTGRVAGSDTLVRAFLKAGAARILAARWDVDSSTTATLMEDFYNALSAGAAPSFALREAQRRMRLRAFHPYHWAGFQLYGFR